MKVRVKKLSDDDLSEYVPSYKDSMSMYAGDIIEIEEDRAISHALLIVKPGFFRNINVRGYDYSLIHDIHFDIIGQDFRSGKYFCKTCSSFSRSENGDEDSCRNCDSMDIHHFGHSFNLDNILDDCFDLGG